MVSNYSLGPSDFLTLRFTHTGKKISHQKCSKELIALTDREVPRSHYEDDTKWFGHHFCTCREESQG
jgi:hypothetical protein